MREVFLPIRGFKGLYSVSNTGKVISYRRNKSGKELILHTDNKGYKKIDLYDISGKRHVFKVHRLVAYTFIGKSKKEMNHIDGDRSNNNVKNLEYLTSRENNNHRINGKFLTGAYKNSSGSWYSKIGINGKYKYLGSFKTPHQANKAYVDEVYKNGCDFKYIKRKKR